MHVRARIDRQRPRNFGLRRSDQCQRSPNLKNLPTYAPPKNCRNRCVTHLMLMGWCSEPDLDCPLGPCDRVGLHQLLNAVFPEDPSVDRMRGGGRADCEPAELLRLQAAGFALGDAWAFGHVPEYRTGVRILSSPVTRYRPLTGSPPAHAKGHRTGHYGRAYAVQD